MPTGLEKLKQDVVVMAAMAAEMETYLTSDVLFWRMLHGNLPMLTLGGYLMRQYRLLRLEKLLEPGDTLRVEEAVAQFNATLVEGVVRLERKAHRELEARLRQWNEYLNDLASEQDGANYSSAVDTRAMIAALIDMLELPPYRLQKHIPRQLRLADRRLKQRWSAGDFVWPMAWAPAYPPDEFWWLYGSP